MKIHTFATANCAVGTHMMNLVLRPLVTPFSLILPGCLLKNKQQPSGEQTTECSNLRVPFDLTQEVSQQGSIVVHPLEPGHSPSHCARHLCSWH